MPVTKAATVVFSPCGSTEKVTELLTSGLSVAVATAPPLPLFKEVAGKWGPDGEI
ncbi:MAG: hypothetical protein HDQ92_07830 [Desulfovibrio sp.]|nr:hypothetical protein [Desulfovibrio sp.]